MVASDIASGAIFRKVTKGQTLIDNALAASSVPRLLKKVVRSAEILTDRGSRHSLRGGPLYKRRPSRSILGQTNHRSLDTLRDYIRTATVFLDNSAEFLDLEEETSE